MTADTKKPCDRLTVGGADCTNQINKKTCSALPLSGACSGRIHGAGANETEAKRLVAIHRLEEYQRTGKGLGHLSNTRALHASPVPFR